MIVEKGQLKGEFWGFEDQNTIFEFWDGHKWEQAIYKYHYHYAFFPNARVEKDGNRFFLHVEDMNDSVEVRHPKISPDKQFSIDMDD